MIRQPESPAPKSLSPTGVRAALERAEHYRLLNEPWQAESICRDIRRVEPNNQRNLILLLLALADQFRTSLQSKFDEATKVVETLTGEYERAYYTGLVCERRAQAQYRSGIPGCGTIAFEWNRKAMQWYEKAEKIRPAGNDDAILRWNSCLRALRDHPDMVSAEEEPRGSPLILDDIPPAE